MTESLREQLAYEPAIEGDARAFRNAPVVIVGGMGGSALPGAASRLLGAAPYVVVHRGYGLPARVPDGAVAVAISHSGETEETLSFAEAARESGIPLAVIATGGKLLALAEAHELPRIALPSLSQPRDALPSMTKALLALLGEDALASELEQGASFEAAEAAGRALADSVKGYTPVFYASLENELLSYLGKIQMNETAKVPAFAHVFPEMNHNELQGFAPGGEAAGRIDGFAAVFLRDGHDPARMRRRMDLAESMLGERMKTVRIDLPEGTRAETLLFSWWLLRTAAQALAREYGVPADEVPLIEAFKRAL